MRVTAWTVALRSIPGDVEQVVLSPVNRKEKTPRNHSLTISQHEKKLPVLLSLLGVPQQGLIWAAGGAGGVANPQHRAWTYGIVSMSHMRPLQTALDMRTFAFEAPFGSDS